MATIADPASDFTALPEVPDEVFTAPLQRPPHVAGDWLEPAQRDYSTDDDAMADNVEMPADEAMASAPDPATDAVSDAAEEATQDAEAAVEQTAETAADDA